MLKLFILFISFLFVEDAYCSELNLTDKRWFVGSSAFVLVNLDQSSEIPPDFYQLNLGYRISNQNTISLELITWKYYAPLGIPYGSSFEDSNEQYPGHVKSEGGGLSYQRFLWNEIYTSIHAISFNQTYMNEASQKIGNGKQLFLTLRFGYHLRFFKERFFAEPSIAFTHWPVNTELPNDFVLKENKWPNYFLFEPGLHIGYAF